MVSPSRTEFVRRTPPGCMSPVWREILADRLTPVSAYERIASTGPSFLLESVEGGERMARYSFIGCSPSALFRSRGGRTTIERQGETQEAELAPGADPLTVLRDLLASHRYVADPGLPRFCGGAVGYLAYDLVRHFEELPGTPRDDLGVDDACLMLADTVLVFDHVRHRLRVVCNTRVDADADAAYDEAVAQVERIVGLLRASHEDPAPQGSGARPEVASSMTQWDYEAAVDRAKEYIAAGDAFQVVPSVRFTAGVSATPFELYRSLRSINPSPYMYFLDFGERQVVGSSPEILVTVEDGRVTVRPIAGTRPRGATPEEDAAAETELLQDAKERAEHIMLVDLGRNDIGRVCEYGTVAVDELMVVERYSHVMHIVSGVSGRLAPGRDMYDAVRACFPAGTLTGAPKIRAMEIIDELEPTRRGLYGGAVGYFSYRGDADLAIAIRTMLVQEGKAYIQAGAGVVADSDPSREYQECVNKARALMKAVEMAEMGLE
jgi:anthranilate synthase component 1